MKNDFTDSLTIFAWVAAALAMVFLFKGEPSVWDVWHAKALGSCEKAAKQ